MVKEYVSTEGQVWVDRILVPTARCHHVSPSTKPFPPITKPPYDTAVAAAAAKPTMAPTNTGNENILRRVPGDAPADAVGFITLTTEEPVLDEWSFIQQRGLRPESFANHATRRFILTQFRSRARDSV